MSEEKVTKDPLHKEEAKNNVADNNEVKKDKKEGKKAKSLKKNKSEEELEKILSELNELKDKHIRLQAEFDNFRKRTLKEKMELMKSAGESVLVNILPVIDDFDRALQMMGTTEQNDPVADGVRLIYNKFQEFLKQNGVKEIEAKEKDFDTDLHEAITKIPAPSEELKGKNVDVIQKGYMLNDKVIRFAKVVIGE
ncbi:MAG: nucleotide exchange factor GrpE [Prolixibacteraceae bacterium]|jgi:molecular chaperone GrpE|nr:nucleotide exchange factor GrpE [Prolixibacteraceae bacterium]